MNYHHFTIEERCCLREYYVKGKSYREIARLLGRNVSSVSRELRRNCTFFRDIPRYYPYTAQKKSNLRNSYRHRGMFWKQEVLDYIDEKLSQTWSPEQIAKTPSAWETAAGLRQGKVYGKGIRAYTAAKNSGTGKRTRWYRGKGKAKRVLRHLQRERRDIILRSRFRTERERRTMAKAIISVLSQLPKEAVKTITCDRGSEFACWREIEKALSCDMYFADPYCAWQKGTNENLNGLLREFYPKGRNLSRVSPATLKKNLALLNARPKKVLHYQTPQDLFEQNLIKCCT